MTYDWLLAVILILGLLPEAAWTLQLNVSHIRGTDGRAVAVEISPADRPVNLTICPVDEFPEECYNYPNISGEYNLTGLTPHTKYSYEAFDGLNRTEDTFHTDFGTPATDVSVVANSSTIYTISLGWHPNNLFTLYGPPSGYNITCCNVTCIEKSVTKSDTTFKNLKAKTRYTISIRTYNVNSFGEVLVNRSIYSRVEIYTLGDSRSSLLLVISLSSGVVFVLLVFVYYMRKSKRKKRRIFRFAIQHFDTEDSIPDAGNVSPPVLEESTNSHTPLAKRNLLRS